MRTSDLKGVFPCGKGGLWCPGSPPPVPTSCLLWRPLGHPPRPGSSLSACLVTFRALTRPGCLLREQDRQGPTPEAPWHRRDYGAHTGRSADPGPADTLWTAVTAAAAVLWLLRPQPHQPPFTPSLPEELVQGSGLAPWSPWPSGGQLQQEQAGEGRAPKGAFCYSRSSASRDTKSASALISEFSDPTCVLVFSGRVCLPMQEMQVWSLGWEDPLEKAMTTHSSILAWEIPWTEEPGGLESTGSQKNQI